MRRIWIAVSISDGSLGVPALPSNLGAPSLRSKGGIKICLPLLLLLPLLALSAPAQSAPTPSPPVTTITLGQSIVALTGPWKFHIGDNPKWADPNFDDSQWETVDLTPKQGSFDPQLGFSGFVPGWTAKGHPGYSGFAWYRMRIRITSADGPLALLSPSNFDDGYQVFANGCLIDSYGNFDRPIPRVYYSHTVMLVIPEGAIQHTSDAAASGNIVVAYRFYMAPATLLQPLVGGMHSPPVIGLASAVTAAYHVAWEEMYRVQLSGVAAAILYVALGLLILMLYAFDRAEKILLWPLAACALGVLLHSLWFYGLNTQAMTESQLSILDGVESFIFFGLWLMTWWIYFGLQERKWIRNTIGVLVLSNIAVFSLLDILMFGGSASHAVFLAYTTIAFSNSATTLVLLISIAYFGWRRPRRASLALFLALLLYALMFSQPALDRLHVRTTWFAFGISFPLALMLEFAMLFCFSLVLLDQFRSSQGRRQAMEQDMKQAQEVQQVLIPADLPHVPGLTIESEYRPAREVGGDFFQIVPHPSDGSVLIVTGDVTGHGLQAGMLVALLVGAIRNQASHSDDPLVMMQNLNQRLLGRGSAHATALALRIARDGACTLANAGHMPPYLNEKEIAMRGALPLGMIEDAEFSVMRFQLAPGDRLLLLSDGVAEAQDESGHLFGFDRIQALLQKPITAAEIATTAQNFGQQDDISVMAVTRLADRNPGAPGSRS
ncbi:MAG TPA: PP2C family protein-serine/threonine phosphatase [Acidobacteriaceae bacterium]|nr:PP2C family protein-serine/threonine phosphatase [Acidobacteriaceae bacterium]